MKILFLLSSYGSGGSERTVTYVSKYMAENGHDVTVLTISGDVFYDIGDNVNLQTLNIESGSCNVIDRCVKMVKRFVLTRRAVATNHPDVVFCMLPFAAKFILGQKRRCGYKLISSERNFPSSYDKRMKKITKKVFRECDGLIFQTERAKDFYEKVFQDKSVVIHNAVGNPLVYDVPVVCNRRKTITAMGRLTPQKDYKMLIDAFLAVVKKHPEYRLEIYGEGDELKNLTNYCADKGVDESVFFKGAHKDAILKISDSSVYVMSSRFEGMPNALMEAMAAGLPCISTDCPNGPAELIENGVNGLLVPVGDAEALSEAIIKMIEDREFAERCGKNARKILETHSIDQKAKEYTEYIEKVLNTK